MDQFLNSTRRSAGRDVPTSTRVLASEPSTLSNLNVETVVLSDKMSSQTSENSSVLPTSSSSTTFEVISKAKEPLISSRLPLTPFDAFQRPGASFGFQSFGYRYEDRELLENSDDEYQHNDDIDETQAYLERVAIQRPVSAMKPRADPTSPILLNPVSTTVVSLNGTSANTPAPTRVSRALTTSLLKQRRLEQLRTRKTTASLAFMTSKKAFGYSHPNQNQNPVKEKRNDQTKTVTGAGHKSYNNSGTSAKLGMGTSFLPPSLAYNPSVIAGHALQILRSLPPTSTSSPSSLPFKETEDEDEAKATTKASSSTLIDFFSSAYNSLREKLRSPSGPAFAPRHDVEIGETKIVSFFTSLARYTDEKQGELEETWTTRYSNQLDLHTRHILSTMSQPVFVARCLAEPSAKQVHAFQTYITVSVRAVTGSTLSSGSGSGSGLGSGVFGISLAPSTAVGSRAPHLSRLSSLSKLSDVAEVLPIVTTSTEMNFSPNGALLFLRGEEKNIKSGDVNGEKQEWASVASIFGVVSGSNSRVATRIRCFYEYVKKTIIAGASPRSSLTTLPIPNTLGVQSSAFDQIDEVMQKIQSRCVSIVFTKQTTPARRTALLQMVKKMKKESFDLTTKELGLVKGAPRQSGSAETTKQNSPNQFYSSFYTLDLIFNSEFEARTWSSNLQFLLQTYHHQK